MATKNDTTETIELDKDLLLRATERISAQNDEDWKPTPFLSTGRATTQLVAILDAAFAGGRKPAMLRGLPGGGKTEFVKSWGASRRLYVEFLNLSQMDPTDLQGHLTVVTEPDRTLIDPQTGKDVIVPGETYTKYTKPEYARNIDRELARVDENGNPVWDGAVLFIDEYGNAAPSMKAASLTLVQNKRINNLVLPENLIIVGAMNEVADGEDGYTLGAPSANRLLHLNFVTDFKDWVEGMLVVWNQYRISPAEQEQRFKIVRFLSESNVHWYNKPDSDDKAGGAWPSPRSWDNAASVCAYLQHDKEAHLAALDGYVGEEAAKEYHRWHAAHNLPSYEAVMANPTAQPWDTLEAAELYYVLQNVVARVSGENVRKTADVFVAAAERGITDVTTALVDELCDRSQVLAKKGLLERRELFDMLKKMAPYASAAGISG